MKENPKEVSQLMGKYLQLKRKKAGLTQEELAHRAELDVSTISRLERGAYSLALNKLPQLVSALRADSISKLFDGYEEFVEMEGRYILEKKSERSEKN